MLYTLRPATEADFPAIRELIHAVQINPTGLDWRRFILAVTLDGEMVGCGQIKAHRDGSLELASIAVVPTWRKRGVATEIIRHLIASCKEPLYLTCRARLGSFYEQFGFRAVETAEMPPYFLRIFRLVQVFQHLKVLETSMLVMKYDP